MIQVHVYVRTCRFKSCFPHVEPLIFKGSKIFITTVLLPYYYRFFGSRRSVSSRAFFDHVRRFDCLPHVTVWGIRKPSGLRKVSVRFIVSASPRHGLTEFGQQNACTVQTMQAFLRSRLLRRFVGDQYAVLVLTPVGMNVDTVEIHESQGMGQDE